MINVRPCRFERCFGRLPCHLSKGILKQDCLDIYLNTSFGVSNFANTSAIRVIFYFRMFKSQSRFQNGGKKIDKQLFEF